MKNTDLDSLIEKFEKWDEIKTKARILEQKIKISQNSQILQKLIANKDLENALSIYKKIEDENITTSFSDFIEEEIKTCIKFNYIKRMKTIMFGLDRSKEIFYKVSKNIYDYFSSRIGDENNINDFLQKIRYIDKEFRDFSDKLNLRFDEIVEKFLKNKERLIDCLQIDKWIEECNLLYDSHFSTNKSYRTELQKNYCEMELKYIERCKDQGFLIKNCDRIFLEDRIVKRASKYGNSRILSEIKRIFNNLDSNIIL